MNSVFNNYQVILDSIGEGVFTVNLDWEVMSFNKAAEEIIKIKKNEAIGKPCCDILKTSVCDDGCYLKKTIETGQQISTAPVLVTRSDGSHVFLSISTAVLNDSYDRKIGGVVIFRDLSAITKLRKAYLRQHSFDDIISKNEKMIRYFQILPQISDSKSTVLIEGATGTGKEIIARAIHNNSQNKDGPFIAVNCGALPDSLVNSELFGHKKGAFTDAQKDKPGRFALAQNGTIFLDEIGDVSQATQVRLLRVLQEKCYEPLGGTEPVGTNARVIAASHHDLNDLVNRGLFREDLYYRINVIKIALPTLSERKEDIPLLVDYFIEQNNHITGKKVVTVSQDVLASLMFYDWPGNIRELENVIEHAFVLCSDKLIAPHHLPERFQMSGRSNSIRTPMTINDIEKDAVIRALNRNNWKKMVSARELGIDKNTLRRKIIKYNIVKAEPRSA